VDLLDRLEAVQVEMFKPLAGRVRQAVAVVVVLVAVALAAAVRLLMAFL
jgi:hypothetical protein